MNRFLVMRYGALLHQTLAVYSHHHPVIVFRRAPPPATAYYYTNNNILFLYMGRLYNILVSHTHTHTLNKFPIYWQQTYIFQLATTTTTTTITRHRHIIKLSDIEMQLEIKINISRGKLPFFFILYC